MTFKIRIIRVFAIYFGLNFYVGIRLFQFINSLLPAVSALVFAPVYAAIVATVFLSFTPLSANLRSVMRLIGGYWLGAFVFLLQLFLLADLVLLLAGGTGLIPGYVLPTTRFYAGAAVVLLTAATSAYGCYNASRIKHVSYDIKLNSAPAKEIKIVFIADLHLGEMHSERHLKKIVEGINSQTPDIVCLVGDIFNDDFNAIRRPEKAMALFRSIDAAYGVYACLGNHDGNRRGTLNEMMNFLENSGVELLNDVHTVIDETIVLIGRLDASPIGGFGDMARKDFSEIISGVDTTLPAVVIDHNPANIGEYGGEVSLILSGHTHRGQLFPFNLLTRSLFTVDYGHYRKDPLSPHVIVTQGVSTWMMPMRVGTSNEIVSVIIAGNLFSEG